MATGSTASSTNGMATMHSTHACEALTHPRAQPQRGSASARSATAQKAAIGKPRSPHDASPRPLPAHAAAAEAGPAAARAPQDAAHAEAEAPAPASEASEAPQSSSEARVWRTARRVPRVGRRVIAEACRRRRVQERTTNQGAVRRGGQGEPVRARTECVVERARVLTVDGGGGGGGSCGVSCGGSCGGSGSAEALGLPASDMLEKWGRKKEIAWVGDRWSRVLLTCF